MARRSSNFDDPLEEDVDDESVADRADHPEEEEEQSKEVLDPGMDGREGGPVRVRNVQDFFGGAIGVLGAFRVVQVVVLVEVDLRAAGHLEMSALSSSLCSFTFFTFPMVMPPLA